MHFFDDARKVADDSAKLLVAGQIDDLHRSMSPFAKPLSVDKFREYLSNNEQRDGKILDYKFLGQNLLFTGPSELDLQDGGLLITHYSVRTTKWEDRTYLNVWTLGVKSAPMLQGIELDHYGPDLPDPYENAVWKTAGVPACTSIKGTLKIRP